MSGIQAIAFDLYGTLIDIHTHEGKNQVWDTVALFTGYYGANIDGDTLRRDFDSERKRRLKNSREQYPEINLEEIFSAILHHQGLHHDFLAKACCKLFRVMSRERFSLFPEVTRVLTTIKGAGYHMAAVSNAQRVFSLDEMRMLDLDHFFEQIIFSSDTGFQKPDPRIFSLACSSLGVAPAVSVYIGDNPEIDIAGAKQIGMRVIILKRGRETANPQTKPDIFVNNLEEALEWIRLIP